MIMQSTPVPIGKISTLGLILSVNTMSIYMIFSFLPFMVEFYFPGIDRRDLGECYERPDSTLHY